MPLSRGMAKRLFCGLHFRHVIRTIVRQSCRITITYLEAQLREVPRTRYSQRSSIFYTNGVDKIQIADFIENFKRSIFVFL